MLRRDFCQFLTVVQRESHPEIVAASLYRSHIWKSICQIHLHVNMRLRKDSDSRTFLEYLLRFRNVTDPTINEDLVIG